MESLASIIIPTFNRSNLLVRALDSVYVQSYRPIEILIVDDGSTDNTAEVVTRWRDQYIDASCVIHYFRKENGGPASCRNMGLSNARGEYIYFLDSDDYMHENLLADAIAILESENSDCVMFGFNFERPGGIGHYLPPTHLTLLESFLLGHLWGYTPSIVRRAGLVKNVGFWNGDLRIAEDYEYLGRTLLASTKSSILPKHLLTVCRKEGSLGSYKDSTIGLENRLNAENTIVSLMISREDVACSLRRGYANRLFKTAINMYARKEPAFAKKLGELASKIEFGPLSIVDKCKRFVWRHGKLLSPIWSNSTKIYSFFNNKIMT